MRKVRLLAPVLAGLALVVLAPAAGAHPLGNFSVNHLTYVSVSSDQVQLRYILDQAEIPTFQERGLSQVEIFNRKRDAVQRGLLVTVNGRRLPLTLAGGAKISFPPGQGGLKLTRVELPFSARIRDPRRVEIRDQTFPGRVGWKAIVARPGGRTAVRSDVPSGDPTDGLRRYPQNVLDSPLDQRIANLEVRPGTGTLAAPEGAGGPVASANERSGDGFAGVFSDAASGKSVLILLLLAAFGWGALHALSPGHGKGMVAAYLVGTRGTARHAIALGATVTFTHTIGVFMLGLVTLLLSAYILPEDLYPWLNLAAGLLVVTVGLGVLRSRLRSAGIGRGHKQGHTHPHHAHDDHGHGHAHDHGHAHHHNVPGQVTWRGLVGMGIAAGLLPCPSALVVLLGAIAQHQVALGLLLIVTFSLGLAATLTALGLAVVLARRAVVRLPTPGRLVAALPAASALVIVAIGFVLTAQALPQVP
jgi:nickel/cobalt exporter